MARIAICWELGGGLGHVVRLSAIADRLAARGHEPVFVLRDPAVALRYWGTLRHRTLAAPAVTLPPRRQVDVSWADVLWFDCGFHDANELDGVWCAWHDLLRLIAPDIVLTDGAPVALAAAASLGLPCVQASNPFFVPPAPPWPSFRRWEAPAKGSASTAHLAEREAQLLERANAARRRVGAAPAASLADVFAATRAVVFTIPELDPYAPRAQAVDYVGPVAGAERGETPRWPDGNGARVFVYAKRDYVARERLSGALARLADARIVYYADGDAPSLPAHVAVHTQPLDIARALPDADVVVCHAGNLVTSALLAGKPVLALPMQAEQLNTGLGLVATGAGLTVTPPLDRPDFLGPLKRLVAEPSFRDAARAVAERHRATLDPAKTADRVAAKCLELLRVK